MALHQIKKLHVILFILFLIGCRCYQSACHQQTNGNFVCSTNHAAHTPRTGELILCPQALPHLPDSRYTNICLLAESSDTSPLECHRRRWLAVLKGSCTQRPSSPRMCFVRPWNACWARRVFCTLSLFKTPISTWGKSKGEGTSSEVVSVLILFVLLWLSQLVSWIGRFAIKPSVGLVW